MGNFCPLDLDSESGSTALNESGSEALIISEGKMDFRIKSGESLPKLMHFSPAIFRHAIELLARDVHGHNLRGNARRKQDPDYMKTICSLIQRCFICRPSGSPVTECWDRTQDCCDFGTMKARRSHHSARSHPQLGKMRWRLLVHLINQSCGSGSVGI